MYCPKCGNQIDDSKNFCPFCGFRIANTGAVKKEVFDHDMLSVWPEWVIEKRLGKGSYGTVYQVIRNDNNIESRAAIKVISIPSDPSEIDTLRSEGMDITDTRNYFNGIVEDFIGEIRMMESLKGAPNIVAVEDYKVVEKTGEIGWDIYIRMELLTPFERYVEKNGLSEKEIIKLGYDICSALDICDRRSIIHRDIKPGNIFIDDYGYFKLGDFGIARELQNSVGSLSQKGTMSYMAPEVVSCSEYDLRVDIYSLGLVLYRAANFNRLPFVESDSNEASVTERKMALDRRIRGEELSPPENASEALSEVILRACSFDPDGRYSSAAEMKMALKNLTKGEEQDIDRTIAVRKLAKEDLDKTVSVKKPINDFNDKNGEHLNDSPGRYGAKSNTNKRRIMIFCISGIAVLMVILTVLFFASSAFRVYSNMRSEDFDKAVSEYHSAVEDRSFQSSLFNLLMNGRVDKIAEAVDSGRTEDMVAIRELAALDKMNFDEAWDQCDIIMSEYADTIVYNFESGKLDRDSAINDLNELKSIGLNNADSYISRVNNSPLNAFEKGNSYYENGDYVNAIAEFSRVPQTDVHYAEAQEKLSQTCKEYLSIVAESANTLIQQSKYKEAVVEIDVAYDVVPKDADTTEIDAIRIKALDGYKATVEQKVDALIADNNYDEAFSLVDEAVAFENSEFFINLKIYTEEKYVTYVSENVKAFSRGGNVNEAKHLIDDALGRLPDNAVLIQLKNDFESGKLEQLSPLEYFIENADKMYFTKADFATFSAYECRIARNSVYAKHGRIFNDAGLRNYFLQYDWYNPSIAPDRFSESLLNKYQMANRDLISEYEREKGYQ
ncbi:MAG: protein kinase [Clostridia bacterium]|nr:protein kinase [Clostridia bacterium]